MYSAQTLSITEIEIIGYLYKKGSLLPSELAVLTKVKAQSMSQFVNRLESNQMIERKVSESDKRKTFLSLTAWGREQVEQTRYERDEWLSNAIEKTLTKSETKILTQAIEILNKLAHAK
jgi:DNA-binding MarR family transcriptional regulator